MIPDEEGETPELQQKLKKIKAELKKCEAEKKEYLEGWQRAKADYINYRKEEGKRFEDMAHFVTAGLIQEILPVLDSFDLAMSHGLPPETEKGILLIRSQLLDVLKKRGLDTMDMKIGDDFNPAEHESIGELESGIPPGKIAEEVQKGYLLRERVLRPARVRLSKTRLST